MEKYHRAKREDFETSRNQEISISLGSVEDSFEDLQQICKDKSNELLKTVTLEDGKELKVFFWTKEEGKELIGVSTFIKNEHGLMTFSIDFSLATL